MNMLEDFRPDIEREIAEIVVKGSTPLLGLGTMLTYHLGFSDKDGNPRESTTGKYLRPSFCLAVCAGLGGRVDQALPAAASIELAHRTSLIFDDIQDKGLERNGQASVWSVWGVDQAINAGFALSSFAHLALQRSKHYDIPEVVTLEAWELLENAVVSLCEGQYKDVSFGDRYDLVLDDYLEMVRGKTGALFATACEIGAMIGALAHPGEGERWFRYIDGRPVADIARDFGMNLGIAFQIHDDYLGVWGKEEEVGKTANDLAQRKRSLPLTLALDMVSESPRGTPFEVRRFLRQRNIRPQTIALFKGWLETVKVPDKVRELELEYVDNALSNLSALGVVPEWQEEMAGVLRSGMERKI